METPLWYYISCILFIFLFSHYEYNDVARHPPGQRHRCNSSYSKTFNIDSKIYTIMIVVVESRLHRKVYNMSCIDPEKTNERQR